jgi:CAAX protease family protein
MSPADDPSSPRAGRFRTLFMGPSGLRAGWRLLIFHAVSLALSAPPLLLLQRSMGEGAKFGLGALIAADSIYLVTTLGAIWVMTRIERRRFADYGIPRIGELLGRRFGWGAAIGFGAVVAVAAAVWAGGGLRIEGIEAGSTVALGAIGWLFGTLLIALFEELFFRGYFLSTLAEGIGFWPAAVLQSLYFGWVLHYLEKDNETLLDGWSVSLIVFLLCWTIARSGDIAWAIGFHWTFNFTSFFLVGSPNTAFGGPVEPHLLRSTFSGPDWLTGGATGLEASVMTTIVIFALFAFGRRLPGLARKSSPA